MDISRVGLVGIVASFAWGCSGDDPCTSTYADGSGSIFSGTSCEDRRPSPDLIASAEPDEDSCIETFAFGCDPDGRNCGETYRRECPDGVTEKTREPGCFKTRTDFIYVPDPPDLRPEPGSSVGPGFQGGFGQRTPTEFFQPAIDRMNELLNDGGSPRMRLVPAFDDGRGVIIAALHDISQFRVFERGVVPGFENAAGLARCSDQRTRGREFCTIDLVMENIRLASSITGSSVEDITNAVALHELGHALCIQHLFRDPTQPNPAPIFTAMNSALLRDADNPASRYFTLDSSEVASVREATEFRPAPGTVFERGFDAE